MESNGQIVHVYETETVGDFKTSNGAVLSAIANQKPLLAICGDEWLPENSEMLTGGPCPECKKISPKAFRGFVGVTDEAITTGEQIPAEAGGHEPESTEDSQEAYRQTTTEGS